MKVKSYKVKKKEFLGVDSVLLSYGAKSTVTKMLYKKGDNPPPLRHSDERSGYVISGRYNIVVDGTAHEIGPGDSYYIPRNVDHRFEIIEPGEVLDFFSTPRNDPF
jgi:quercetin dioxygenase-like cupin family protein